MLSVPQQSDMNGDGSRTEPFPVGRRTVVDAMRMAGRRNDVHGLVEFDVTEARRRIDDAADATGTRTSFTAFLVHCFGRAVRDHPNVQRYLDWRGRLVGFEDVDVMVVVETTVDGEKLGVPRVLRRVNDRSLASVHREIRAAQRSRPSTGWSSLLSLSERLPGVVRRQFYRLPRWSPRLWKRVAGTVGVTSVGMFGSGGGWGVTPTNYPLQLTVGGISEKPRYVDGELEPREFLHLTVTVDHDVVDGAPAARFVERLRELVEAAHGLESPADES
nr:2-oxo acid dehydrogenase subunit E2 [Halogeometricum sp. CBA1124]